jgi:hypothetical protein
MHVGKKIGKTGDVKPRLRRAKNRKTEINTQMES